jgi:hypothetical protein
MWQSPHSELVVNQEGLFEVANKMISYALKPSWFNVPLARHCESPFTIIIAYWNLPG